MRGTLILRRFRQCPRGVGTSTTFTVGSTSRSERRTVISVQVQRPAVGLPWTPPVRVSLRRRQVRSERTSETTPSHP